MADIQVYNKSSAELELAQRRSKKSMRGQVTMFSLMIFLTLVSFAIVTAYQNEITGFSSYFIIPIILLFAAVQVTLQLYYFMHMNEKGHEAVQLFIYGGVIIGFVTILGFVTIVWW